MLCGNRQNYYCWVWRTVCTFMWKILNWVSGLANGMEMLLWWFLFAGINFCIHQFQHNKEKSIQVVLPTGTKCNLHAIHPNAFKRFFNGLSSLIWKPGSSFIQMGLVEITAIIYQKLQQGNWKPQSFSKQLWEKLPTERSGEHRPEFGR